MPPTVFYIGTDKPINTEEAAAKYNLILTEKVSQTHKQALEKPYVYTIDTPDGIRPALRVDYGGNLPKHKKKRYKIIHKNLSRLCGYLFENGNTPRLYQCPLGDESPARDSVIYVPWRNLAYNDFHIKKRQLVRVDGNEGVTFRPASILRAALIVCVASFMILAYLVLCLTWMMGFCLADYWFEKRFGKAMYLVSSPIPIVAEVMATGFLILTFAYLPQALLLTYMFPQLGTSWPALFVVSIALVTTWISILLLLWPLMHLGDNKQGQFRIKHIMIPAFFDQNWIRIKHAGSSGSINLMSFCEFSPSDYVIRDNEGSRLILEASLEAQILSSFPLRKKSLPKKIILYIENNSLLYRPASVNE